MRMLHSVGDSQMNICYGGDLFAETFTFLFFSECLRTIKAKKVYILHSVGDPQMNILHGGVLFAEALLFLEFLFKSLNN